jgi:peptidoglycan hydrolase-like protein with peptidoglycan-binding domain
LVREGLEEKRVREFFNESDLTYSPAPMETKLRELFGIFYNSDLTKAVQEKLFQLGYDIVIDGRNGPGTKKVITAFEKDKNLPQTGKVTKSLDKHLDTALVKGRARTLSEYKRPPSKAPDRSVTYKQFTNNGAIASIKSNYATDKKLFDKMEVVFDVPGPLVASIMWIETGYGNYFGKTKLPECLLPWPHPETII